MNTISNKAGIISRAINKKNRFQPKIITINPEKAASTVFEKPIILLNIAYCVARYFPLHKLVIKVIYNAVLIPPVILSIPTITNNK